jgi:pyruvate kinase
VAALRRALESSRCASRIVVKIEKPQAIEHLEAIIAAADAVMVARGDLGVEMALQQVPAIQKRIIALCNQTHRPVITATQMLNSMEHSSRPTRAEASDVFNAVVDGTDAVMLSGESAIGQYPVEAVSVMRDICVEAEAFLKSGRDESPGAIPFRFALAEAATDAAVDGACLMARRLDAALIVVLADSGWTALALSNRRPDATVVALCRTEAVARRLSLCWGVVPVVVNDTSDAERLLRLGIDWAKSQGLVKSGQHAVLLRGGIAGRSDIRAVLAGAVR